MKRPVRTLAALVSVVACGTQAGQAGPAAKDARLDLFLNALQPRSAVGDGGPAMIVPQSKLERLLRILPPVTVRHGGTGAALAQSQQTTTMPTPDPSIYGFCYETCQTARAVDSCGTPGC